MKKHFYLIALLVALFTTQVAVAQAPEATPEEAIEGLLTRIGGASAPGMFEIVIDANLAENGKDVFVITEQNNKPCIKGNTQLSVATGINWYLNHYAHINLTWNNLTTDLSLVTLPVPESEEEHECNTTYRYDFNTCTFSYSMAFWTWDRWQKEIDWMALHGINAPLNLVGLDVVTRNFLKELGVSDSDIAAYVAGPGFIAWFAMNNLEGWGSTVNATDVTMSGNPDWWYTRQEKLCRQMLQRMRELGMQPVIPGFSGQVPNCIVNYATTINSNIGTFSSGDVIDNGTWAGGYTRPDILNPSSSSYETLAPIYYKHLEAVMGVSEFYSMDPFHEGELPDSVTNGNCYPNVMKHLDAYHNAVEDATKTSYNVSTEDNQAKWIIQYWQNIPQSGAFSAMSSYGDRFIGLDLFSDNIYAGNAAKWRDTGSNCYYQGRPYIYCMLHNFGGRSGLHGRLETTMDGYFQALANNNNCQGIGATPEGTETNPILYDMLFELPWMDVNNRPTADEWLEEYAHSRYGVDATTAPNALKALQNLKNSVWNCKRNQQGTSEAIILGRPRWTFGDGQRNDGTSLEGTSVSSWSVSSIYWDTQDVRLAADQLISVADLVTENGGKSGVANYDYDVIDVIRQAMVDYASELLPLIKAARNSGDNDEYTYLYNLFLQLMLDLDTMLSYDENFKLERWTSLARNIADEADGTTNNDRNWLEWNARTQVSVWSKGNNGLNDYSNRCWAGLIKDFHYPRWKYFFENNGGIKDGNWFTSEYAWTVDYTNYDYSEVIIPEDMTATKKAVETFGNYFGRVKGATKNYIFPMGIATDATKSDVIPEVYRGQIVELPLVIGKEVTVSSVQIDLNGDGAMGNGETLTATDMSVAIPADAAIGKTTAIVEFSDGTVITFNLAIIVEITADRTVTATADANMGTVAIEGDDDTDGSITNMEAVKITATANTGYNFENWTDEQGNVVSNDNPYIYYGETDASFTANFIQDKWGVVECNGTLSSDIAGSAQFIHNLTFAYYNREAETILEATTAPTQIFNTIPQIIDVPQGASFTVKYDNGSSSGLQYCYFRAYIDLNADGDFDDDGELLKEVGTKGDTNTAVCSNTINVLLPYDAPLGITHMRLRFDGAWDNDENPSGLGAKDPSIRPVYEIILNITEGSSKAAHVTVKSNSDDWGTAEVWTAETPGWVPSTEWDVSTGISLNIKATPATGAEFLGWYDHYGRLLTTELEYTMLAKEDATYTARFRKFLEIDGWEVEYRTEPGTEIKYYSTTALDNGVAPVGGKKYYIAAHTLSGGSYYNRYLYDNNGTLATSTDVPANCVWTCIDNGDGTFSFQNESGNYLANNDKYHISIGATAAKYTFDAPSHEGVTLYNPSSDGGKFMVTKHDGTAFDRYGSKVNNGSWSSDYLFYEGIVPDNVILTNVRKSGDHDLEIPETVEILGEQCTITGFDNGLFANNKDLWTITLPATIETMSSNVVWETSLNGGIAPSTGGDDLDSSKSQLIDLGGYALSNDKVWTLDITFETMGKNSLYNKWGTILLSGDENASNNQWLYLSANGSGYLRLPGFSSLYNDSNDAANYFYDLTNGKISTFNISIANQGDGTAIVTVTNSEGESLSSSAVAFNPNGVTKLSSYMTTGVNITSLKITEGPVPDPFEGCTNLVGMTVAAENENYYVDDNARILYTADNVVLHTLADKDKEDELRALGELIDLTEALIDEVAVSINPTGTATEIALSATQGDDYYIWCNNPHPDATGNVANLLDEDPVTFLHSNWTSGQLSSTYDYLQIDFGTAAGLDNFKIAGQQRNSEASDDRPKFIEVYGSNDNKNWTPITTVTGLPNTASATWESELISADTRYSHLKFVVTTYTNENKSDRPYFHMAKFDLFKLTSSAEVAPLYKNLAGVTNEEAATVYDSLAEALYLYNNAGTAAEMQAAYYVLKPLYDALNAKKNRILNGVYNINFNDVPLFIAYAAANKLSGLSGAGNAGFRLFDGKVTHDGAPDGNTNENLKQVHQAAIDAQAAADALFTIVPKEDNSGYTLQAQGFYLKTAATGWSIQAFDTDVANAGVYLFEETATDIFKIMSTTASVPYVNDWGPVFGNDNQNSAYATFTVTQVTEYTLNVPESGVTTLCLPFNVILPTGVTAYDITEDDITGMGGADLYDLSAVAAEGETLAKNTPVIVKATAGDYVLTITMSDEGAKASNDGSVLCSDLVKTTVAADAANYTFDGENFNRVTTATEVPANQCYMQVNDKGDVIYNSAAVPILTVDEENPVLYNIYQKRTGNVMTYDYENERVDIAAKRDDYTYQAWYFMKSESGILIKPYNGDGKLLLGANDTGNGNNKLIIATTATYKDWTIEFVKEESGENYYFIKTNGTFVNDFGNETDNIGFWSSASTGTAGSQFKFILAEFSNDNPRYYQLKDVAEYLGDGSALHTGESVGLYDITDYTAAYTAADAIVTAGNETAAADCHDAYTTLRSEYNNVSVNVASPDKIYYIKSVATNDDCAYCTGKYVHTLSASATRGSESYNQAHLVFDATADISMMSLAAFQFEAAEGGYKIKNLHTGLYVKSFAADAEQQMGAEADAAVVKVAAYADGQVTLQIGSNDPMHAEKAGDVIVEYGAEAGNASLWTIEEAEVSDLDYTITMPADGYTTLYLPYNVTLPDGVVAYNVEPESIVENLDGTYGYEFTELAIAGQKLAKGTAVVIKGTAGVEYTFTATLDDTDAISAANTALRGTYYDVEINSDDAAKRYSATVADGELVFNRIDAATTATACSCWLETTVNTTVIGKVVVVETVWEEGAVYRIKCRMSDAKLRTLYTNGAKNRILWTDDARTDAATLFILQEYDEQAGTFKLVSALANGKWNATADLDENGTVLIKKAGSVNGTVMIETAIDGNAANRRFCTDLKDVDYFSGAGDKPAGEYVADDKSTDFLFVRVDDITAVNYTLNMAAGHQFATLYLPYNATVPTGVEAYLAEKPTAVDATEVALSAPLTVVPAYKPVIVYRETATEKADYVFQYTTNDADEVTVTNNALEGHLIETAVTSDDPNDRFYLLLTIGSDAQRKEAFYWVYKEYNASGAYVGKDSGTHIKCAANKAYMVLDASEASQAAYSFAFPGTTAVDEIEAEGSEVDAIYDLQGRKLEAAPEKGIYIVNGELIVK